MRRARRSYPDQSCIVVVNKVTGETVLKKIKGSARLAWEISEYFRLDPMFFVYRVNVHPKRS